MTGLQRTLKYIAIAFGVFLTCVIITSIATAIFSVGGAILGIEYISKNNNDTQEVGSTLQSENIYNKEEVKKLELDIGVSNIDFITSDSLKVVTYSEKTNIETKLEKDTLVIKEKTRKNIKKSDSRITVYIPDSYEFEKVEMDIGIGTTNIQELKTKSLQFSSGVGNCIIENLVCDKAKISGGAGKVIIANCNITNLDLDTGVGEFELDGILKGNNKIDSGVGRVDITLYNGAENYQIHASKGIGNITIGGKKVSDDQTVGQGENKIKIDGGIGSINVNFEEREAIKETI